MLIEALSLGLCFTTKDIRRFLARTRRSQKTVALLNKHHFQSMRKGFKRRSIVDLLYAPGIFKRALDGISALCRVSAKSIPESYCGVCV